MIPLDHNHDFKLPPEFDLKDQSLCKLYANCQRCVEKQMDKDLKEKMSAYKYTPNLTTIPEDEVLPDK